MLNRLPDAMPPLGMMLDDIGKPSPSALAKALGVSVRTVQRWLATDHAPKPAMLAVFWLTRWGQSVVDCEAVNAARLHVSHARTLQRNAEELKAQLQRLGAIGDFGSANDPAPGIPGGGPSVASLSFPPIVFPEEDIAPPATSVSRRAG